MWSTYKQIGLIFLCSSFLQSCSQAKPGEQEVKAWVNAHPSIWNGLVDYDSLQVLVKPVIARDTFELSCRLVQHDILEYMDTAKGEGRRQYQLAQSEIDSIIRVHPKVQVGWTCNLRDEKRQVTLYTDMGFEVDSAYEWSTAGGSRIFP